MVKFSLSRSLHCCTRSRNWQEREKENKKRYTGRFRLLWLAVLYFLLFILTYQCIYSLRKEEGGRVDSKTRTWNSNGIMTQNKYVNKNISTKRETRRQPREPSGDGCRWECCDMSKKMGQGWQKWHARRGMTLRSGVGGGWGSTGSGGTG